MKQIALLLSMVILGCAMAYGQTKEELQQQKQKAFEEIKLAKELMERTAEKRSSSLQQIRILQQGINSRARLISTLEQEVKMIDKDIVDTQNQIVSLTKENEKNKEEYARLIYYAYRNITNYEKLMYVLAGANISQSYQRYKYLKYISDYRVKKAADIERLIAEMDSKKEELNGLRNEKLSVLEEKEGEQDKLVSERSQQASMVQNLQQQEAELKRQIAEKERITRELEERIRSIIEEEARKAADENNPYGALTPEQQLVGDDFRNNKGKLPWPVDRGIITTGFGNHEFPGLRGSNLRNNGVDINSEPGTRVRAVFEGEVTKVFAILGANYTVLIRHGAYLSVYQNLINVRVKSGDKVLTKEILGEAFTDEGSGVSTVHFEVWQERNILNPEEWLSK
ncbi:MAG: murein hydrolase activator EnvC family protein [Bacteroidales bacterium]